MKKSDLSVSRQACLVPAPGYSGAFALVPPPTPRVVDLSAASKDLVRAYEALIELRAVAKHLPNPNLITRTLDRREAVRSSQIEGTHSDLETLFAYESTGSGEGLPRDVVVTLNYVRALEFGLEKVRADGVRAFNSDLVKGLHKTLMHEVPDFHGVPGEYRERQNWIGGFKIYDAKFVPPPASSVVACMTDLEEYLRNPSLEELQYDVPIIVRMAIVHAQFETIHPFIDGNGRVGRLLSPLMLAAEGYPPVYLAGFLKMNQQDYYRSLAEVQLQDKWVEWVSFFANAVEVASRESIETANDLLGLMERWEVAVRSLNARSDAAINKMPELLLGNPVVTVNQVSRALNVSFPAANAAIKKMVDLGILVEPAGRSRDRVFVATELVARLNALPDTTDSFLPSPSF